MSAPLPPPGVEPVLVCCLDAQGRPQWGSNLPIPNINLLCDSIKQDILTGRVKSGSPILPPSNGDISQVNRLKA